MAIDLHAHSLASDGSDDPAGLVEQAAVTGIEVLAVTDHDTVEGLEAAIAAGKRLCVQVVPGCEITGELAGRVVHLLAYGDGLLAPGAIDSVVTVRRDASSATCASATGWRR
jgi:predicted metal-dependent phosphoesterase TrpH